MTWSTVSKAADKSSSKRKTLSCLSIALKISDCTFKRAVSVLSHFIGRLKHFLKSICIEVISKLAGYSFLGDLRQQFQIRDRPKMREQLVVERVLFELGSHIASLKWRGTFPVIGDKLTILVITGNNVSRHSLSKMEGNGSRSQVLMPDETKYFLMSLVFTVQKSVSSDWQQEGSGSGLIIDSES